MAIPPLTTLICISRDIPRATTIRNLLTFFANADGMTKVWSGQLEHSLNGTFTIEKAAQLLSERTDEGLNNINIKGMLGDFECVSRLYTPDRPLMVEQPQFIQLTIEQRPMHWLLQDWEQDPAYNDQFALPCIALCEQLQAFFAPFIWLQFEGLHEMLAWYGQELLQEYISGFVRSNPLVYCDAATYERWAQANSNRGNFQPRKVIALPSGAKAIFSYNYVWFCQDDIARNVDWLRRSLTQHLAIHGVIDLLTMLRDFDEYLPLATTNDQEAIFRQVDAIRLLWATALQRSGVRSIMLPTANAADQGIVPIIADGGHEWCLYNTQQIDDIVAPAAEDLWKHALALRDASAMLSIKGTPPHIVVVAWPPFSRLMRNTLIEAGIDVISSTQEVPLIYI